MVKAQAVADALMATAINSVAQNHQGSHLTRFNTDLLILGQKLTFVFLPLSKTIPDIAMLW